MTQPYLNPEPFFLIAGPCVIESSQHCHKMAQEIKAIADSLKIPYIFKASFDKANRTSLNSYRGVGIEEGLKILSDISQTYHIPVLTDVHTAEQVQKVAEHVDVLQIPAFLCRQTDLLVAVGKAIARTGKAVNIKKGQFCNHIAMRHAYHKVKETIKTELQYMKDNNINRHQNTQYFWGDNQVWLCDRGNMYGYDDLVVDMRGLVEMRYPTEESQQTENETDRIYVVQDATHALQQPNRAGKTLGQRHLIPTIARSAVATGVNGLFMEVHDNPAKALSDATTQWPLSQLSPLLTELVAIHRVTRGRDTQYIKVGE